MSKITAPNASLITDLRSARRVLKGVALLVAVAFTMLILAPTAVAARDEYARQQQEAARVPTEEAQLSRTLQRIEARLARFSERLERRLDTADDAEDLAKLRRKVERLDHVIEKRFGRIGERLQERGLSPVILERHRAMVATYRAELSELLVNLDAVELASDADTRAQRLDRARKRLLEKKQTRSQQPFDPRKLPTQLLRPNPDNKPRTDPGAFRQSGLFDTPYAKLAALGEYRLDGLPGADDPAFLAESDEVVLTQAIREKAAELAHDPVAIYHWVRNHIEWQPGWGAAQDAELTLQTGRGNAMDTASLTIALLRASGIPARYAHGTIEIPEDRFRNWAGGFENIYAAADYVSSGGVPITTLSSGGRVTKVRLEHIWVEAAIDFHPSRGAKNYAADSWVPIDPSFKQYEYRAGLDAVAIGDVDPEQLVQGFLDSGTLNETEGWATGFDAAILADAQQQAQTRLEQYIADNLSDPTVGDIVGGRKTIVQEFPLLPSALVNRIVTVGATYGHLPAALQQRIVWSLGVGGAPVSFPWARTNNRKVTLSFRPATEADEQALQGLLPEGAITDLSQLPEGIPAYLIEVVPELKLDGEVVVEAAPMALGEELDFTTHVIYPTISVLARTQTVVAGSFLVINSVAANVSGTVLDALRERLEVTKGILEEQDPVAIGNLTREDLLGDIFHAGSLGYFAQLIGLAHIAGLQSGGHFRLGAGLGTFGYEPEVSYFFGVPRSLEPGGVALDIPFQLVSAVDGGDIERRKQFNLQIGVLSSALEHAVPEQMFGTEENPADAISADKALQKANAEGQRIYHITRENMTAALANIGHDAATMAEIRAALAVGKDVITHSSAVTAPGWRGAGYVILDSETGVGAWKIGGGTNGSMLIMEAFFELFWWMWGGVKYIARANIIVSAVNFLIGITDIVNQCSGASKWGLILSYVIVTSLIISLTLIASVGGVLAYGVIFALINGLVFDIGKSHFCK
jgi:hypothetical protein